MGLRERRLGLIVAVAGVSWFLGDLAPALVLLHRGPLVQLHISYPTGRVRRPLAVITIVAAYAAGLGAVLIDGPWLTAALATLVAWAAIDVFRATHGPARKAGVPALVAAWMFCGVMALSAANVIFGLGADRAMLLVYDMVICVVVCWLTLDLRYGRWTEATLADMVTQLGSHSEVTGLQGELRRRLADPTLVLGLRDPRHHAAYVDERGVSVLTTGLGVVSPVLDGADQVAILVHDPVLLHDPRLLQGATRAVGLVVSNSRGRREVAARGADVAASSRRIVEAADAQRVQLRQDLEFGAHRHLHEVAAILQAFDAGSNPATREQLGALRSEVDQGLDELRRLASGIQPEALTSGGLAAALPPLAANLPIACHVAVTVGRLPPAIESAVYFFCTEALTNVAKHAQADQATVVVEAAQGDQVLARVSDDGRGGADPGGSGLRGLTDRVTALGGSLHIASGANVGTTLEARFPQSGGVD